MKKLEKIIKTKILLLTLGLLSTGVWARTKTVGMVSKVSGNVFVLQQGKAKQIRPGHILELGSEVLTEEGSIVTFTDYFDHKYHLAGSGHVKFLSSGFELTKGYLWIQSYNREDEYAWKTANSTTSFVDGEAILSFDSLTGKSQIMVISKNFNFSNIVDKHLKLSLRPGEFSFVDNNYNKGIPRKATKIGYKSYKRVTSLFPGRKTIAKYSAPFPEKRSKKRHYKPVSRGLASDGSPPEVVSQPPGLVVKPVKPVKKEVLFLGLSKKARKPASLSRSQKIKKWKKASNKKSDVKVKIYGLNSRSWQKKKRTPTSLNAKPKKAKPRSPSRAPAAISSTAPSANQVDLPTMDVFEKSLVDQYKKQMRHSKEVNSLIDELKNYKSDFQKEY